MYQSTQDCSLFIPSKYCLGTGKTYGNFWGTYYLKVYGEIHITKGNGERQNDKWMSEYYNVDYGNGTLHCSIEYKIIFLGDSIFVLFVTSR